MIAEILSLVMFWMAHSWWQVNLFSPLLLIVTWPMFYVWALERPLWGLVIFSQLVELMSTLTPGIVTGVVLLPGVVKLLFFKKMEVGFSVKFLMTVLLQVVVVMGILVADKLWINGWYNLPWDMLVLTVLASTVLVFLGSSGWREVFPAKYD